jgi:phosphatidylglycerol---prolipoprotein diacylglyceryl transferase
LIYFGADPVMLQVGSFSLRWYGTFLTLAVVWVIFWMWLQVKKGAQLSVDTLLAGTLVAIPSGLVFARLLHVIDDIVIASLHPELADSGKVINYLQHPGLIIGGEGLTIWGAILGAVLGVWIYFKIAKIKGGYIFDLLAPACIMAQAIGRLGCLFNGCCYGTPTSLPWGLVYTDPMSFGFTGGIPTHPTVVYEMIYCVIIFVVLLMLRNKLRPAGSLFMLYLALYAVWRLGIDFMRDGTPFLFGLHQAQIISIIVLLITVPWMVIHTRWVKKNTQTPPTSDKIEPSQSN